MSNGYRSKFIFFEPWTLIFCVFFQVYPWNQILPQIPAKLVNVSRTAAACLMVTTNHVKPARDMYPVPMVAISTDPALTIVPVRNLLCGMMWKNAVNTRARHAYQKPHQQLVRLSHQALPPQQQLVILEHLIHVSRTVAACLMVIINLVKPVRDMYPVPMVAISTDPALPLIPVRNLLCGMMWRNAVNTRARLVHQTHQHQQQVPRLTRQPPAPQQQFILLAHVYQTVEAFPMVTINHVKPARDMYPVPMLAISTDPALPLIPVRNLLCGMMWRNAVNMKAQLVHQPPHQQQEPRLTRQPPAPQQQFILLAHVYQTVEAFPMVTTNHVKPVRDMYPVPMVAISTDPALPLIPVRNLLCGMMWRNAVNTRARLVHQTHQHQQQVPHITRQAPAPRQQLKHLPRVCRIAGTCPTVLTHHVKPMRNMWNVKMVCSVRKPAQPVKCGIMWWKAVWAQLSVSQTVGTCLMVATNHVNFVMALWPAPMVFSVSIPANTVIFGMMWWRTV